MTLTPIIETTELTIYGSPDTISIVSDIGPQGERGSLIFSNIGDPAAYTSQINGIYKLSLVDLKTRDMYYRIDTNAWYQWSGIAWQLRSGVQKNWKRIETVSFTNGEGSKSISISQLWNDISNITASNVFITYSTESTTPRVITLLSKSISSNNLVLNFFAYNIISSQLSVLNGSATIYLDISLV